MLMSNEDKKKIYELKIDYNLKSAQTISSIFLTVIIAIVSSTTLVLNYPNLILSVSVMILTIAYIFIALWFSIYYTRNAKKKIEELEKLLNK